MRIALILLALAAVAAAIVLRLPGPEPLPPRAVQDTRPAPSATATEPWPEPDPWPTVPDAGNADATDSGTPEIERIDVSGGNFMTLLRDLGLEDSEERLAEWALNRGYPRRDPSGNLLLDQPYDQYDEETLRALAATGDRWAQQFLAERLARTRPAEAIEWYRRAAVNGSVYAMTRIAMLYHRLSGNTLDVQFKDDQTALEQIHALRDSQHDARVMAYAWVAAAEQAGWEPMSGAVAEGMLHDRLDEAQSQEACDIATGLRDGLLDERSSNGLDSFDMTPPPVVFDPGNFSSGTACSESSAFDLTACRQVEVVANGTTNLIWICD